MMDQGPFWKTKALSEMTLAEWESLCDGCGQCCLLKFKDDDMDDVLYTNIACRLLDDDVCRCTSYADRHKKVPDCTQLGPENIPEWMPDTCAYKLIKHGLELPEWHPLVSGSAQSVHDAGVSVRGKVICETLISAEEIERQVTETITAGIASGEIEVGGVEEDDPST